MHVLNLYILRKFTYKWRPARPSGITHILMGRSYAILTFRSNSYHYLILSDNINAETSVIASTL